jgi:hypothetical protein
MFNKLLTPALILAGAALLAGCAENSTVFGGSNLTTASVPEPPKTDPACISLATQIEGLKKEGIADKIAQASIKKYKMTPADLTKADQLNRTNTEFQAKCSTVKPAPVAQTAAAPAAPAIAPAVAKAVATKAQ